MPRRLSYRSDGLDVVLDENNELMYPRKEWVGMEYRSWVMKLVFCKLSDAPDVAGQSFGSAAFHFSQAQASRPRTYCSACQPQISKPQQLRLQSHTISLSELLNTPNRSPSCDNVQKQLRQ
jgi:hypothetical protein